MRGQGIGSALLHAVEETAAQAGCRHVLVDSMDFQAPGFYQRHGYTEFAVLSDHPTGHTRHFFQKRLVLSSPIAPQTPQS
jgi:predicted N-acetyltransferase YhbS